MHQLRIDIDSMENKLHSTIGNRPTFKNYSITEQDISRINMTSVGSCSNPQATGGILATDSFIYLSLPPLDLQKKILKLVEYYFSDEYLEKDSFFLRQILKKRDGFLSIKFITKFKKIRKLVDDSRITCHCLRGSSFLLVNDEGSKVKRKSKLPTYLKVSVFPQLVCNIDKPSLHQISIHDKKEPNTTNSKTCNNSVSLNINSNWCKNSTYTPNPLAQEFKMLDSCISSSSGYDDVEDDKLIRDVFEYVLKHTTV